MDRYLGSLLAALLGCAVTLGGCTQSNPSRPESNNPSPTAGSGSAQRANGMADKAMYKPVEYKNATVRGPNLVVIPETSRAATQASRRSSGRTTSPTSRNSN